MVLHDKMYFFFSVLRNKLSKIFDACIEARPCKDHCNHRFKNVSTFVTICLTLYSIIMPLKYHVFENIMENFGANAPFSIIF